MAEKCYEKPRLCEILGTEVRERFEIENYNFDFFVNEYGYLVCEATTGKVPVNSDVLCKAIQCPGYIIRKPKWTKQDVDDAKAIKRLMPWIRSIGRDVFGALYLRGDVNGLIDASLFPGLNQNKEIDLDEILKEEAKNE